MASRVRMVLNEGGGMLYTSPRRVIDRLRTYIQAYHRVEPNIVAGMGIPSWVKAQAMFLECKNIPNERFVGTLWICRERRGTRRGQSEYFKLVRPPKKQQAAAPAGGRAVRGNPHRVGQARFVVPQALQAEAQPAPQAANPFQAELNAMEWAVAPRHRGIHDRRG